MSKKNPNPLRASDRARYHDLFEKMWDSAFILSYDRFEILDANHAVERETGQAVEGLFGKTLDEWVAIKDRPHVVQSLRRARRRSYPHRFQCDWYTDSGKARRVELQACVLRLIGEDGEASIEALQVIVRDITELHLAQETQKRYLEDLEKMNQRLEELSITDEMTGLANYRHFMKEAHLEGDRSQRYYTPFAIIFCDVDHFKHFNDTNGHQAGDECLREIARILKIQCRTTDLAARYGGEEFAVLCRGVTWEGAKVLAGRICQAIGDHDFEHGGKQPLGHVTISIGVAGIPDDGNSLEEVIEAADQSLYASKSGGRNQVTTYQELESLRKIPTEKAG